MRRFKVEAHCFNKVYCEVVSAETHKDACAAFVSMAKEAGVVIPPFSIKSCVPEVLSPLQEEAQMAAVSSVLHLEVATLGVSKDKGQPITEANQLGTVCTMAQLAQLAEKYLGKPFEKGTKKSEACNQLYTAMCKAAKIKPAVVPVQPEPAAPVAAKAKAAPAYVAPEEDQATGDEEMAAAVPTAPKATKVKKVREPKPPRKYTFISLGKAVTGATVKEGEGEAAKSLSPQGVMLYDTFCAGRDKGQKLELTKEEVLAALTKAGYKCAGNVWNNVQWYRMKFKAIGCVE